MQIDAILKWMKNELDFCSIMEQSTLHSSIEAIEGSSGEVKKIKIVIIDIREYIECSLARPACLVLIELSCRRHNQVQNKLFIVLFTT
jgi:hypothetical protein